MALGAAAPRPSATRSCARRSCSRTSRRSMVIALYPLLPPRWVPGMPFAVPAPEGLNGPMHNATAAAASQHVGYPLFIAASTVWLTNRARWSWLTFLYPAAVFTIVLGTANHYTLDAIIGGLCIVFGFATARLVHGSLPSLQHELTARARAVAARRGRLRVRRPRDRHRQRADLPPHPLSATDMVLSAARARSSPPGSGRAATRAAAPAGSAAAEGSRRTPAPARDAGLRRAAARRQRRRRAQAADEGARAGARGARARGRRHLHPERQRRLPRAAPGRRSSCAQLERAIEQRSAST